VTYISEGVSEGVGVKIGSSVGVGVYTISVSVVDGVMDQVTVRDGEGVAVAVEMVKLVTMVIGRDPVSQSKQSTNVY